MPVAIYTLCDIDNPHQGFRDYTAQAAELVARHGGRYIVRGKPEQAEGAFTGKFLIGIELPDEAALAAFQGDYKAIVPLRDGSGSYESAVFKTA